LDPDPRVPETNRSSEMRITVLSQTTPSGSQFPEDPSASITRRRNEIVTGEKKYLRAAYLAAPEIRISE